MKIKKLLAVFMSLLMLCSLFFSVSASALIQYSGGIVYERLTSTKAEIVGLQANSAIASSEIVTIPEMIKSYTIYRIGKNAFSYNTVQKEVIMPDTITEIGDYAFTEATALQTVTIPAGVKLLGAHTFSKCTSLKSVTFNTNSLSIIPRNAFYSCTVLDNVILPSSINTIDTMAFASCANLNKIYIPSTVSSIADNAFLYSDNVTVYGQSGSSAYYYALNKNIPFVNLSADKNTAELDNAAALAQAKLNGNTSGFSQEVVSKLREELAKVETLKNDFFTTQSDIDTAAQTIANLCEQLSPSHLLPLQEVIAKGNQVLENSALYTQASVNELSDAVASAQALLNKSNPTATEVNSMVALVNEKINALVLKSKVNLQNLVNRVNTDINKSQYQYTEASVNRVIAALNEANSVLAAADSTNDTYNTAYNALTTAYNSLSAVKKGDADLDDTITIIDAIVTLKNVVGTHQFNERAAYAADLNADNNVSVLDAVLIQRAVLGM